MTMLTRARRNELGNAQRASLDQATNRFYKAVVRTPQRHLNVQDLRFIKFLGKGGFGAVYAADRNGLVAVKVQEKAMLRASDERISNAVNERVYHEALVDTFIPGFIGTFRTFHWIGLVIEYAPYGDLKRILRNNIPATEREALYYVPQIVCALEFLHASTLIYGDLKPENCLIYAKGRLKISDFGLTQVATDNLNTVRGTTPYMAPEIFKREFYDEGIDWWALGVLIFKLLRNLYPFQIVPNAQNQFEVLFDQVWNLDVLDQTTLSGEAKDLIRGLLDTDRTKRLGAGATGVQEIQRHLWFRDVDFVRVRSTDYAVPDFNWEEPQGGPCDADLLHNDPPANLDPADADFDFY